MTVSAYARGDVAVLQGAADTIQAAGQRLKTALPDAMERRVNQPLVGELATEPPVHTGARRWKSARQRIFVMAMLRKANNLPYKRTHALVKGWRVVFTASSTGGVFYVENPSPVMRYVQGDQAQPMHLDSGWPQLTPTLARYKPLAVTVVSETWLTVNREKR